MAETPDYYNGQTPVRVAASDVHKAVRNILANEMNFDLEEILRTARNEALNQYLNEITKHGERFSADLDRVVRNYLDSTIRGIAELEMRKAVERAEVLIKKELTNHLSRIVMGVIRQAGTVPVSVSLYVGQLQTTIDVPVEVIEGPRPEKKTS